MDYKTISFRDWILKKADRSNKILAIIVVLIILNYFIPDPIPFIDELFLTPVLFLLLSKILTAFGLYRMTGNSKTGKATESKTDKEKPPKNFIEGEVVED